MSPTPPTPETVRPLGPRLAETLGAMLGFTAGASLGLLVVTLAGGGGWRVPAAVVPLALAGALGIVWLARQRGRKEESPDGAGPAAPRHRFRPQSLAPYLGGLALGLSLVAWGARGLLRGQLAPALYLGLVVLASSLFTLRSRMWRREVTADAAGLELREGTTVRSRLGWEEVRRLLVDPHGSLFLDVGSRERNLLLPAPGAPWATFYVTGLEELGQELRGHLGGRVVPVDSMLRAIRELARAGDAEDGETSGAGSTTESPP